VRLKKFGLRWGRLGAAILMKNEKYSPSTTFLIIKDIFEKNRSQTGFAHSPLRLFSQLGLVLVG
jgi:hypothetical protein